MCADFSVVPIYELGGGNSFCIALNTLAGIIVWRKIVAAQPQQGIILLEPNQFRFEGSGRQIQGLISNQSRLLGQSVWLYINGFSKTIG